MKQRKKKRKHLFPCLIVLFVVAVFLTNNHQQQDSTADATPTVAPYATPTPRPWTYFQDDEVVDSFFVAYNAIAKTVFPKDAISRGNIRTKAGAVVNGLEIEVIYADWHQFNDPSFLAISVEASEEIESSLLKDCFFDILNSMRSNLNDSDIQIAWNELHRTGYLLEDYVFNDIKLSYIPQTLRGNIRIDFTIPVL